MLNMTKAYLCLEEEAAVKTRSLPLPVLNLLIDWRVKWHRGEVTALNAARIPVATVPVLGFSLLSKQLLKLLSRFFHPT